MKTALFVILHCLLVSTLADNEASDKHLPPVASASNSDSLLLGDSDEKSGTRPLIGRPDGHEGNGGPIIGRKDGHENRQAINQTSSRSEKDEGLSKSLDDSTYIDNSYKDSMDEEQDYKDDIYDSSMNYNNYDNDYNNNGEDDISYVVGDDDDDAETLLRCKRPLCNLYCKNGYQTDETGCPVCTCLEDPCLMMKCANGFECRREECLSQRSCVRLEAHCEAVEAKEQVCATPMCATDCPAGYAIDSRGCMTCDCVADEKEDDVRTACPQVDCIFTCTAGYKLDAKGCTTCQCKDSENLLKPVCAIPMCANYCPTGYRNNANGCMTCDCNDERPSVICAMPSCDTMCERYKKDKNGCMTCDCDEASDLCGEKVCESNEICLRRSHSSIGNTCIPKPLCEIRRQNSQSDQSVPQCDMTGSFSPLQCDAGIARCWCVDDRGVQIDGTLSSVDRRPVCYQNITVVMVLRFVMYIESQRENILGWTPPFVDQLSSVLPELVGEWMLMDKQFITVLSNTEVLGDQKRFQAELMVRRGEDSDLPSALEHMKGRMGAGRCSVPLRSVVLVPESETLQTQYKFSYKAKSATTPGVETEEEDDEGGFLAVTDNFFDYCVKHSFVVMSIGVMCCLVLLTLIILTAMIIYRRRRMQRGLNFEHQRLHSQVSTCSEKSLVGNMSDKVLLVSAERVDERASLA